MDQPFDFVDCGVRLALGIRVDRHDLVFAANAALLIAEIDRDLRADRRSDRPAGGERTGQIVDDPPMRSVSASARARFQSRLKTAVAAAEFFSSALREVGIVLLPTELSFSQPAVFCFGRKYLGDGRKVNTRLVRRR